jgi:hypothetical protein
MAKKGEYIATPMTSWIRTDLKKKEADPVRRYLYRVGEEPFCSTYLNVFADFLYAQNDKARMTLYEGSNLVGAGYPLWSSTFQDISGLELVETIPPNTMSLARRRNLVADNLKNIPLDALQVLAQQFFQLNGRAQKRVQEELAARRLPTEVDIVVQIQSVTAPSLLMTRAISVPTYVSAVRDAQKALDISGSMAKPTVLVVADDESAGLEFKKLADPSWKVVIVTGSATVAASFSIGAMLGMPRRQRETAYQTLLLEIALAQEGVALIGNFSSPLTSFLFLTMERLEYTKSLDGSKFRLA